MLSGPTYQTKNKTRYARSRPIPNEPGSADQASYYNLLRRAAATANQNTPLGRRQWREMCIAANLPTWTTYMERNIPSMMATRSMSAVEGIPSNDHTPDWDILVTNPVSGRITILLLGNIINRWGHPTTSLITAWRNIDPTQGSGALIPTNDPGALTTNNPRNINGATIGATYVINVQLYQNALPPPWRATTVRTATIIPT